jgi:uracil-DNA glycosylase
LWKDATQTVFGEGPTDAKIMFVGEQPGDREDRDGHPFVGPVRPEFIVALGATAAQSLTGRAISVQSNRGAILDVPNGLQVFVTIHPSALLRLQEEDKRSAYAGFVNDLRSVRRLVERSGAKESQAPALRDRPSP